MEGSLGSHPNASFIISFSLVSAPAILLLNTLNFTFVLFLCNLYGIGN